MKLQKGDIIFFSVCFLLLSASLYGLYLDYTHVVQRQSTKQIGTIVFKRNTAERKFTAQTLWGNLHNNAPVYNYDTIRTGDEALADVTLDNGSQVELGPNTLVVLNIDDQAAHINFSSGAVLARGDSSNLNVSSENLQAKFENGEMSFSKDAQGNMQVQSNSADALLLDKGKQIELGKDQVLAIDENGKSNIRKVQYKLVSPPDGESTVSEALEKEILFTWQGDDSLEKTIWLSPQADFSNLAYRFKTKENRLTASVEEGVYYWKVSSKNGESSVQRFQVLRDVSLKAIAPPSQAVFDYFSVPPLIRFNWSNSKLSRVFELEIFSDRELKHSVKKVQSQSTSIVVDSLNAGTYYWRVRTVYPQRFKASLSFTEARKIEVRQVKKLSSPQITQPQEESVLVTKKMLEQKTPAFFWQPNSLVATYLTEIAKDKNFSNVVSTAKINYNYFVPPANLTEGEYYFRVTALDDAAGATKSSSSVTKILQVKEIGELKNISPSDNSEFFMHNVISLRWRDDNKSTGYKVEISRSANFEKLEKSFSTHATMLAVDSLPAGVYYWRVISFDSAAAIQDKGNVSFFRIKDVDKNFALISPADEQVIDLSYANAIEFKWTKVNEASDYRIEIISSQGEKIYSEVVRNTSFKTSKLSRYKENEKYSWQVIALTKTKDKYTYVSNMRMRSFKVILSQKIQAPTLKTPKSIVIYEK